MQPNTTGSIKEHLVGGWFHKSGTPDSKLTDRQDQSYFCGWNQPTRSIVLGLKSDPDKRPGKAGNLDRIIKTDNPESL